jgi:tripartite-type tricarboxylate transporter receptor subunit TctC
VHGPDRTSLCCSATLAGILLLAGAAGAAAQPAELFKGKTIHMHIGFEPGGSYDQYGRLVARHLPKHLAGTPTIVPMNQPGVAGLRVAGFLYEAAPRDGSVIGVVPQNVALADILGTPGLRFKAAELTWIGRVTSSVEITVMSSKSKVKTIEDAKQHAVPVAGSASGAAAHDYPLVLNNLVGTKFNVIPGYQSAAAMMLAMERGETEGSFTSWNTIKTTKQAWLAEKTISIPVQYATERHADLPDVPTMVELGKSREDQQILTLYASGAAIGRSIVGPPGMPAPVVKAMRDGFEAMLKDPDFLADIQRSKAEFDPLGGAKLQEVVASAGSLPAALVDRAKTARQR